TSGALDPVRVAAVRWHVLEGHARAYERAKKAICSSAKGSALDGHLAKIAPLYVFTPYDTAELREALVAPTEAAGGYSIS
ncbi:MAG TPA: acyl-CoA dehydrogenase, partial [Myxococcaceae bacterium]|nr:acyl-CoA dehydrogenase [Myxococcaceae bacterium]